MISSENALLEVRAEPSLKDADVTPVGSTYILGAGCDVDVLALVDDIRAVIGKLTENGWVPDCGSGGYEGAYFLSVRKGDINLIVTAEPDHYRKFKCAADVCKYLRVSDKAQRIHIHEMIRDGKTLSDIDTF